MVKTEKEKNILLNDNNAWIGIPIASTSNVLTENTTASGASFTNRKFKKIYDSLKTSSPFSVPVIAPDHTINRPPKLTGVKLLRALGWISPLETTSKTSNGVDNISGFKSVSESRDVTVRKEASWNHVSHLLDQADSDNNINNNIMLSNTNQNNIASKTLSSSKETESMSLSNNKLFSSNKDVQSDFPVDHLGNITLPTRGAQKFTRGITAKNRETALRSHLLESNQAIPILARSHEKQLLHMTAEQLSSSSNFMYASMQFSAPLQIIDDNGSRTIENNSSKSAWSKLKSDVNKRKVGEGDKSKHDFNALQMSMMTQDNVTWLSNPVMEKKIRSTVWPQIKQTHYKFKYTWIPQPMIQDAAKDLYLSPKPSKEELAKQADEESKRRLRKSKLTALKDESTVSSLTEMYEYEEKRQQKLREVRLQAEKLKHPYHWL